MIGVVIGKIKGGPRKLCPSPVLNLLGKFFEKALALLVEAEMSEIKAEEMGAGKPVGSSYWTALTNHPECYIWNPGLAKDETGTWSGECSGGFVQGKEHASIDFRLDDTDDHLNGDGDLKRMTCDAFVHRLTFNGTSSITRKGGLQL